MRWVAAAVVLLLALAGTLLVLPSVSPLFFIVRGGHVLLVRCSGPVCITGTDYMVRTDLEVDAGRLRVWLGDGFVPTSCELRGPGGTVTYDTRKCCEMLGEQQLAFGCTPKP